MSKILLVDDDVQSLDWLSSLIGEGHELIAFQSSVKALDEFQSGHYDLALLDVHMPFYDGFQLYKLIRQVDARVPICFITKDDSYLTSKRALAFEESLFLKPGIAPGHLAAHIEYLISKSQNSKSLYEVSFLSNCLIFDGVPIALTPRECRIMSYLLDHELKLSKEILKDFVWEDVFVSDKTLNAHLTNLREKLKDIGLTLQSSRDGNIYVHQKNS